MLPSSRNWVYRNYVSVVLCLLSVLATINNYNAWISCIYLYTLMIRFRSDGRSKMDTNVDGDPQTYIVSRIMDHRTKPNGEYEYFVRWKATFAITFSWDICRRNDDSCKQQPNLVPIQSEHERVSFKMEISWRQPIEKTVKIQKRTINFTFLLSNKSEKNLIRVLSRF